MIVLEKFLQENKLGLRTIIPCSDITEEGRRIRGVTTV